MKRYTVRLEVRITKEEHKIIKEMQKKYKLNMNETVRRAINEMWEKV